MLGQFTSSQVGQLYKSVPSHYPPYYYRNNNRLMMSCTRMAVQSYRCLCVFLSLFFNRRLEFERKLLYKSCYYEFVLFTILNPNFNGVNRWYCCWPSLNNLKILDDSWTTWTLISSIVFIYCLIVCTRKLNGTIRPLHDRFPVCQHRTSAIRIKRNIRMTYNA